MSLKNPREDKQNWFTLQFYDKRLEAAFQASHAKNVLPQIRLAIIIAALLYAVFSILDFIVIPEDRMTALAIRFAFAIPLFALTFIATYRFYFRKKL